MGVSKTSVLRSPSINSFVVTVGIPDGIPMDVMRPALTPGNRIAAISSVSRISSACQLTGIWIHDASMLKSYTKCWLKTDLSTRWSINVSNSMVRSMSLEEWT